MGRPWCLQFKNDIYHWQQIWGPRNDHLLGLNSMATIFISQRPKGDQNAVWNRFSAKMPRPSWLAVELVTPRYSHRHAGFSLSVTRQVKTSPYLSFTSRMASSFQVRRKRKGYCFKHEKPELSYFFQTPNTFGFLLVITKIFDTLIPAIYRFGIYRQLFGSFPSKIS